MITIDKLTVAALLLISFLEAVIVPIAHGEYSSFNAFWFIILILSTVLTIYQYQDEDN